MNVNADILVLILSKTDNDTLFKLASVPLLWEQVCSIVLTSEFWRLRIECILLREVSVQLCAAPLPKWKEAYYILARRAGFINSQDNHLVATILLSLDFDPAADDNLAIKKASRRGLGNILRTLLESRRVDVRSSDDYCIRIAHQYSHQHIVSMLQEYGAVLDSTASSGDINVSRTLADMSAESDRSPHLLSARRLSWKPEQQRIEARFQILASGNYSR